MECENSYGRIAYEAYCTEVDWKSVRGDKLPEWEDQDQRLRTAWEKAALAVVQSFYDSTKPS